MTDDHTDIEARLARTLQAVAGLVPDEPPPLSKPDHAPPVTIRLESTRGTTPPGHVGRSRPRPRGDRRTRVVLAGAVALLVVVVVGVVLMLASHDDSEEHGRVDTPAGSATTAAPSTSFDANLVEVPNVLGKSVTEAQSLLGAAGFAANAISVPSAQPSGTVVTQDPSASRAARGSIVTLGVSTGG